jgi:hypothetical protein
MMLPGTTHPAKMAVSPVEAIIIEVAACPAEAVTTIVVAITDAVADEVIRNN